jgi:hypothetical protein
LYAVFLSRSNPGDLAKEGDEGADLNRIVDEQVGRVALFEKTQECVNLLLVEPITDKVRSDVFLRNFIAPHASLGVEKGLGVLKNFLPLLEEE